jgi:signal transduction histidine kinase
MMRSVKSDTEQRKKSKAAMISVGVREQVAVAAAMISIIPVLVVIYVVSPLAQHVDLADGQVLMLLGGGVLIQVLGYVVLLKYPRNIVRLSKYLAQLAAGEVPDSKDLRLHRNGDDLAAVADAMEAVIHRADKRIRTIEQQTEALVAAEQQRAMIESLGAACHHMGQPTTVITTLLDMISRNKLPQDVEEMVNQCRDSASRLGEILERLRSVAEFRSEPYVSAGEGQTPRPDESILHVPDESSMKD